MSTLELSFPAANDLRFLGSQRVVGCRRVLGNDFNHAVRGGELKTIPGFDASFAADAFRHRDFSFGFEGDGHAIYYKLFRRKPLAGLTLRILRVPVVLRASRRPGTDETRGALPSPLARVPL